MKIDWQFVKRLSDNTLIKEFETLHNIKFDECFIEAIMNGNGGYPKKDTFDTSISQGNTIQCLLSFNKTDEPNIWNANENVVDLVRFACNDFGGYLVIDVNGNVLFQNHETGETEFVADSFIEFVKNLY